MGAEEQLAMIEDRAPRTADRIKWPSTPACKQRFIHWLFNGSGTNKLRAAYEMALRQSRGYLKEKLQLGLLRDSVSPLHRQMDRTLTDRLYSRIGVSWKM